LKRAPFLHDDRQGDRFHFLPGRKTDALVAIAEARGKASERGVVFLRTITLLEGLKPILAVSGLPLFELTGEKPDHERKSVINRFRVRARMDSFS
jgi:superfamily II DNA/RNA helicase